MLARYCTFYRPITPVVNVLHGRGGGAAMSKWLEYERLKTELRRGKLTPKQYEEAIKELVKQLRL